jgi:hypothetical protein
MKYLNHMYLLKNIIYNVQICFPYDRYSLNIAKQQSNINLMDVFMIDVSMLLNSESRGFIGLDL